MKEEIGSFMELDLWNVGEYYDDENMVRLNSARAGIYHSCKLYGVKKLYVPYYLSPTVTPFLVSRGIEVYKYKINDNFEPLLVRNEFDTAILIVNYFGIMSSKYIKSLSLKYRNIIVDNSPAFYSAPLENCFNVYSPRSFFGVPDGCYVIGPNMLLQKCNYPQDESSDTAAFLLKRIEKGCNSVYAERMKNEERINKSGVLRMSKLTQALLSNINYNQIKKKRKENFAIAHELYAKINLMDPLKFYDEDSVPMVYPLVIKNTEIVKVLADNSVYTGRWWKHVLSELQEETYETFLSEYMIPIPIDQRYTESDLKFVAQVINDSLKRIVVK